MSTLNALGVAGVMIIGILAAQTAVAERELDYERTITVRAADLDLSREGDARELYDRIGSAARRLCMANESTFDPRKVSRRRSCVRAAIGAAIERADVPMLTAVHLQQSTRLTQL